MANPGPEGKFAGKRFMEFFLSEIINLVPLTIYTYWFLIKLWHFSEISMFNVEGHSLNLRTYQYLLCLNEFTKGFKVDSI